jgi:hypothetical protein
MWINIFKVSAGALLMVGYSLGQTTTPVQSFPLSDTAGLVMAGKVKVEAVEYRGRKAFRLIYDGYQDGFAVLPGTDFQDGVICTPKLRHGK